MRYKLLGASGLRVSELCLGTMTFGEDWGWGASGEESRRIFDAFIAAGGNFVDTANRYTDGTSERLVGELIAAERERLVVATKYSLSTRRGDPNAAGSGRKNMVQSLEASLRSLRTDYVDLYWVHVYDALTPIEEMMRGLDDLVRAGKVLHVGISDTPAWVVARANTLAMLRGWTPFVGLQIEYNLVQRAAERELLPMARALDLGVLAWSPLASGVLTGKYRQAGAERPEPTGASSRLDRDEISEQALRVAEEVVAIAAEIGCAPSHVALNWLRGREGVVIPVVGARRAAQLEENLACLETTLAPEHLERLEAASAIELGFPHDFLASSGTRDLIYGGTFDFIDNHRDG